MLAWVLSALRRCLVKWRLFAQRCSQPCRNDSTGWQPWKEKSCCGVDVWHHHVYQMQGHEPYSEGYQSAAYGRTIKSRGTKLLHIVEPTIHNPQGKQQQKNGYWGFDIADGKRLKKAPYIRRWVWICDSSAFEIADFEKVSFISISASFPEALFLPPPGAGDVY